MTGSAYKLRNRVTFLALAFLFFVAFANTTLASVHVYSWDTNFPSNKIINGGSTDYIYIDCPVGYQLDSFLVKRISYYTPGSSRLDFIVDGVTYTGTTYSGGSTVLATTTVTLSTPYICTGSSVTVFMHNVSSPSKNIYISYGQYPSGSYPAYMISYNSQKLGYQEIHYSDYVAPSAGTVYSQQYTGVGLKVVSNSSAPSTDFYSTYPGTSFVLGNPPTVDPIALTTFNVARVKIFNTASCDTSVQFVAHNSDTDTGYTFRGATTTDGYCILNPYGFAAAPAGNYDYFYIAPSTGIDLYLDGSFANQGYTVNGYNDNAYNGGFYYSLGYDSFDDSPTVNAGEALDPFRTRIDSLSPVGIIATSTPTSTLITINVTGYINPTDYASSTTISYTYNFNANSQASNVAYSQAGLAPNSGVYSFTATSSGAFSFSTTTTLSAIGTYNVTAAIVSPTSTISSNLLNFFFDIPPTDSYIVSTTTSFTLGGQNGIDLMYTDLSSVLASGSVIPTVDCDIFSGFDLTKCLYSLLIPSQSVLKSQWDSLVGNAFSVMPIGYLTRFISIISGATAIEPPPIEYTYGTSAPAELQGKTISFQIFDNMGLVTTIKSDQTEQKNLWEIVMPYFNTIIALGVLGVILNDLLSMRMPDFSDSGSSDVPVKSQPVDPRSSMTLDMRKKYGRGTIDMRKK